MSVRFAVSPSLSVIHGSFSSIGKVCPTVTVAGATASTDVLTYETEVVYTCDAGFLLDNGVTSADMVATCVTSSQWNQTIPDCRRKSPSIAVGILLMRDNLIGCFQLWSVTTSKPTVRMSR